MTENYAYGGRGGRPPSRTTTVDTRDYSSHALLGNKIFTQSWSWNDLGAPLTIGYPTCGGMSPCNVIGLREITNDYANGWLTNVRQEGSSWGSLTYHDNGMVDSVTHSNYVQSVYAKDPWQMQRPRSVSTRYGAPYG